MGQVELEGQVKLKRGRSLVGEWAWPNDESGQERHKEETLTPYDVVTFSFVLFYLYFVFLDDVFKRIYLKNKVSKLNWEMSTSNTSIINSALCTTHMLAVYMEPQ